MKTSEQYTVPLRNKNQTSKWCRAGSEKGSYRAYAKIEEGQHKRSYVSTIYSNMFFALFDAIFHKVPIKSLCQLFFPYKISNLLENVFNS